MSITTLSPFENLPYFTIAGFRQILGNSASSAHTTRVTLSRRVKAGHIIRLKKGVYMHRQFYERHRQDAAFSALVSAILLPQSYLSLEFVLQQHNILTEITYPITAITTKNTRQIQNDLGTFVYRHIRPGLYQGFHFFEVFGVPYTQATLAKALFDYFYLRPLDTASFPQRLSLADELRLNLEDFTRHERAEFAGFVTTSNSPKMQNILANLEKHIWLP